MSSSGVSTRNTTLSSRAAVPFAPLMIWTGSNGRSVDRACGCVQRAPVSRRQSREARGFPAGAGAILLKPGRSFLTGNARGAAEAPAILQRRQRSQALFRRSARAPRILIPVEISRHVAVPMPEPVLDPLVPRIRVRRLPPDRRLRGRLRAMARVAEDWASRSAEHAGRGSSSTAARQSARGGRGVRSRPPVVINADFARAMTRLVPDACAAAGPTPRSPARDSPARPSCSISGSKAISTISRITRSTIAADYERNLDEIEPTHPVRRPVVLRPERRASTDPSLAPTGISTLYVLVPVTQHASEHRLGPGAGAVPQTLPLRTREASASTMSSGGSVSSDRDARDWDHDTRSIEGATFNLAHTLSQMLHLRPHNRFEDLDGSISSAAGRIPAAGLPVIFEGARITTRLLLEDRERRRVERGKPQPATTPIGKSTL